MICIQHIVLAMKPMDCNFAENAIRHGVAGINVDGCRIENEHKGVRLSSGKNIYGGNALLESKTVQTTSRDGNPEGRFPPNVILEDSEEIVSIFPSGGASGIASGPTKGKLGTKGRFGPASGDMGESCFYGDKGTVARFFKKVKET